MNADQLEHNAEFFARRGMETAVDGVLETLIDVYGEDFVTPERRAAFDGIVLALQRWERATGARLDAESVAQALAALLVDYPPSGEWVTGDGDG